VFVSKHTRVFEHTTVFALSLLRAVLDSSTRVYVYHAAANLMLNAGHYVPVTYLSRLWLPDINRR
jgi:hypothetical protein